MDLRDWWPQRGEGYGTRGFVSEAGKLHVTSHGAQNIERSGSSAIDARTTRHAGYALSIKARKLIEESFGWAKGIGLLISDSAEMSKSGRHLAAPSNGALMAAGSCSVRRAAVSRSDRLTQNASRLAYAFAAIALPDDANTPELRR